MEGRTVVNRVKTAKGMVQLVKKNSLNSVNNAMAMASASGVTICTATGDYGSNNGVGGSGNYVDFPSSSPYATAIGGTTLVCQDNTYTVAPNTIETAWSYGGGGVSQFFSKPSWQSKITATGRTIPDIGLNSNPSTGVYYLINGNGYIFGGTSIAAPAAAAFFALNKVTTFVNPILYNMSSAGFHDIISGNNGGYSCKIGYDYCTGLGSLNGTSLNNLLYNVFNNTYSLVSMTQQYLIGSKITLLANPLPPTVSSLSWSSSNIAVATVDNNGVVSLLGYGSVIITCTNNSSSVTFPINISRVAVTSITLSPSGPITSPRSTPVQLIATVLPFGATNKSVTWTTSSSSVATVDTTGKVTGKKTGTVTIRSTSVDSPGVKGTVNIKFT